MLPLREHRPHGTKVSTEDIQFEIEFFRGVVRRDPQCIEALQLLGDAYTKTGQWRAGLKIDERLAKLCPDSPIVFYNLACSYSLLKHADEALAALDSAIRLGYDDGEWLSQDPDLTNLRGVPQFQEICQKLQKP